MPEKPPDAKATVDRLLEGLSKLDETIRARAQDPPRNTPPLVDPNAPPPPIVPTAVADKFDELINAGKGREAIEFFARHMQDTTVAPAHGQMKALARAAANANLSQLRSKYGEKFTKRELLFREQQRVASVPDEWLMDMDTCERLFALTIGADRDAYVKEESESLIVAAVTEREAQLRAESLPLLAPISAITHAFPETERERVTNVLKHAGFEDDEVIRYLRSRIEDYNSRGANITWPAIIRQIEKQSSPRHTVTHGVGPFRKRTWTMTGEHPEDERAEAERRAAATRAAAGA